MLAGLVKNPTGYDPTNSPTAALERRNVVLDRMAELNVITPAPRPTKLKKQPSGCTWCPEERLRELQRAVLLRLRR